MGLTASDEIRQRAQKLGALFFRVSPGDKVIMLGGKKRRENVALFI